MQITIKKSTAVFIAVILLAGFLTYRAVFASKKRQGPNSAGNLVVSERTIDGAEKKNIALPVKKYQASLQIKNMTCSSCATGIEYALKDLGAGIIDAKVEYPAGSAVVIYDANLITIEDIIKTIKPYEAELVSNEPATNIK